MESIPVRIKRRFVGNLLSRKLYHRPAEVLEHEWYTFVTAEELRENEGRVEEFIVEKTSFRFITTPIDSPWKAH